MSRLPSKPVSSPIDDARAEGLIIGVGSAVVAGATVLGLYKLYQAYSDSTTYFKLSYFNGRGLAEVSRLLFAISGTDYEDHRFKDIPQPDGQNLRPEFNNMKENYPFGQVPVLQVGGKANGGDGIILSQSRAIERYLARKFGLLGANEIEAQLIDSVGETIRDARDAYYKVREKPEEKEKFFATTLPNSFKFLNRFAITHGAGSSTRNFPANTTSTFVGSKITLADVLFFNFLNNFDDQTAVSNALASFPALRNIREAVGNHPGVKKWVATRPVTPW